MYSNIIIISTAVFNIMPVSHIIVCISITLGCLQYQIQNTSSTAVVGQGVTDLNHEFMLANKANLNHMVKLDLQFLRRTTQ